MNTDGGRTRRLTVEARASDPDLSPDGRRIVCVLQKVGYRAVAVLDFRPDRPTTPTVIVDEPDSDFTGPRWSPDGRQVVVSRRQRGRYDLVVIDVATRQMRSLVARPDVRLITPSWTPDGRTILFAANVGDEPFNVYAVSVDDGRVRRVTDSVSGATAPDVSPDGRRLLYLGYTRRRLRSVRHSIRAGCLAADRVADDLRAECQPCIGLGDTRFISPVAISGSDVLVAGCRERRRRAADWCRDGDERCARPSCVHRRRSMERRQRCAGLARVVRVRSLVADDVRGVLGRHRSHITGRQPNATAAHGCAVADPTCPLGGNRTGRAEFRGPMRSAATRVCSQVRVHRQLGSIRTGWIHDSRRQFGYSISAEEGVQVEGAVDAAIGPLGSDADSTSVVLDVRGFQRVLGRHTVVAGRVAFAGASGPPQGRRLFSAAGPGPSVAAFDFGRDTIGLLRGVAAEDVVGSRAAVANVDLRFPLAYPERGFGSWPIFLQILALGHLCRCRSGVESHDPSR